ncbi:hypothetical protein A0H81_14821 [Grifola frondosa]|uniref:Uncharacterized protein n=1 Tax=Grifola frondosa TaxID=5627 RepID=A0A1C7LMD7_GRIFR|nr:hypothetical protein A0H81_14821 [Grifola frondosa]
MGAKCQRFSHQRVKRDHMMRFSYSFKHLVHCRLAWGEECLVVFLQGKRAIEHELTSKSSTFSFISIKLPEEETFCEVLLDSDSEPAVQFHFPRGHLQLSTPTLRH